MPNAGAPSRQELEQRIADLKQQNAVLKAQLTGTRPGDPSADDLLQALLDHIPDRIYFKDVHSRFIKCSQAVAHRLGVADASQVVGKSDFDFLPPERAREFFHNEQVILQTGEPLINKTQKQTQKDGEVVWSSVTKVALRGKDGKILGLVGINRDITEHKRAEEALRQSHDALEQNVAERTAELSHERLVLRTLIDNLPDAIYAKDLAGRKTLANPADLINLRCPTEAEAIGKTDFDLFPPPQAEKFWALSQHSPEPAPATPAPAAN